MNIVKFNELLALYGISIETYKSSYKSKNQPTVGKHHAFTSKLKITEVLHPIVDEKIEKHVALLTALEELNDNDNPTVKDAYDQLMIAVALTKK